MAAPRVAAQNAAHGEPKSFERAVFAQGFDGVLRAGGGVAARGRRVGRNEAPIETNGGDEQERQPAKEDGHGEKNASGGMTKKKLLGRELRCFGHLQAVGRTVQQRQHAFVHQIARHRFVGQPNEGEMHCAVLGNVCEE